MKLYSLVLCICFVQMYSWLNTVNGYIDFLLPIRRDENSSIANIVRNLNSTVDDPETPDIIEKYRKSREKEYHYTIYNNLSNVIIDASPQFIEDMNIILKTFKNNTFVESILYQIISVLAGHFRGYERKISVTYLKKQTKPDPEEMKYWNDDFTLKQSVDFANVLQSILSTKLPSERYDGLISLRLLFRHNIPEKEIENALGYLYGTIAEPKYNNDEVFSTYECDKVAKAGENRMLTELQEFSKNNTKINPKVIEDMTIVTEKIPCNTIIIPTLLLMIYQLEDLAKANLTGIDAYELARGLSYRMVVEDYTFAERFLCFDTILSTKIPDQDFTELKKLAQFVYTKMTTDEIGKVLEYVYGPEQYKIAPKS